MSDVTGNTGAAAINDGIYFAPLLPWQQSLWSQLTERVLQQQSLPHALLAAGMQGMGKRAFVWRLVAWLLCRSRDSHPTGACGTCESCQWLRSGTHPSLQVLPLVSMPISAEQADNKEKSSSTAKDKKSSKTASNSALKTKIDDIRALQPFIYQGGQGMRICVLDHAEKMTIAAANALLKTLEEPQAQVHLFLISDTPAQLLPTIKSRVQQLALQTIEPAIAVDYVTGELGHTINREAVSTAAIHQLIQLANGAPLAAIALAQVPWYSKRSLWLTTWQALRSGKRSSIAASDYWQNQLNIVEFIQLSELMLLDMRRVCLGLDELQKDVNLSALLESYQPTDSGLEAFANSLQQTKIALQQNVQEKFAYDKLMQELAYL
ncbi:DNA polymerase III subunit delta' [Psychrobacter sp. SCQQ22]|uniref:DNA polymerase III subunit delta' n=1 Tax=unclassified Psychrobacter TaxID=196806 RepID=UPI0018CF0C53|nr:DNA polymerase III subunit delta' [Psychrobacter sp. SCQQ22]MBH0085345.1 DNA polymerase III subunit delta' [Psychrobacter sp. SCQQ22]